MAQPAEPRPALASSRLFVWAAQDERCGLGQKALVPDRAYISLSSKSESQAVGGLAPRLSPAATSWRLFVRAAQDDAALASRVSSRQSILVSVIVVGRMGCRGPCPRLSSWVVWHTGVSRHGSATAAPSQRTYADKAAATPCQCMSTRRARGRRRRKVYGPSSRSQADGLWCPFWPGPGSMHEDSSSI